MSILKLPHWAIIDKFPAFYDTESATAIEMTGKLYVKINELIDSYNKWVESVNKAIEDYEAENNKDYNCFVKTIVKLTSDYIGMIDLKIIQQNRKFEEFYKSFTSKVAETTGEILSNLAANGELDATILQAVGDLKTKFETFNKEYEETLANLNTEFEKATANFNAAALGFQQTLNAKYNEFVSNTEATVGRLESDYQSAKANLNEAYSDVDRKIKEFVDFRVIYDGAETSSGCLIYGEDSIYFNEAVNPLPKYFKVFVNAKEEDGGIGVLCTARKYQEGDYTKIQISGTGVESVLNENETYLTMNLIMVDLRITEDDGNWIYNLNNSVMMKHIYLMPFSGEGSSNTLNDTIATGLDVYEIQGV